MKSQETRRISKRMSFWLRHRPDLAGLKLSPGGWVPVSDLIGAFRDRGSPMELATIQNVVNSNDKQRFEFDAGGENIRARQGHSVDVKLGYEAVEPPGLLFHGTATRHRESILKTGLDKGNRHHVHLSTNQSLMLEVARRHGQPILVTVAAAKMHSNGFEFFLTENGVWLTDSVPPEYLKFEPAP